MIGTWSERSRQGVQVHLDLRSTQESVSQSAVQCLFVACFVLFEHELYYSQMIDVRGPARRAVIECHQTRCNIAVPSAINARYCIESDTELHRAYCKATWWPIL